MLQLEGKDYDPGQFLQMNGLLTYLGDLNQAHNDLRDLVSKLQLQLENKDKRIKELEGKIQQNAISTDKRCKGIEITINNISKALAGIKGENIRIKEIQVPKDLPSSRTESKMGTMSKEDILSPRKNNEDIVEASPKKSEPSKEEVAEENKSKEEIKEEPKEEEKKEEPIIEEEKKTEPKEEIKTNEEVKEDNTIEENKEEEKNKEEEPEPVKEEAIEEKKEEVVIPIAPPKHNPEEEKILAEGAKKNNTTISPEMISILFKKVKDNQARIEALEKLTDTTVSTSKGLKHLDRNINNRVSNLEKTSKGKIDDCKCLI